MKTRTLVIVGLVAVFILGVAFALLRELRREEAVLAGSISGVVEVARELYAQGVADVVRTDRLVLMLVDPETREPVALHFESPLVPPQTIRIGQDNARGGAQLQGSYLMVGITDKDGEIFRVTPGEVYGRSSEPVPLGTEEYRLVLDEPFRGSLFNEPGAAPPVAQAPSAGGAPRGSAGPLDGSAKADPRFTIGGTITVAKAHQDTVRQSDRLILLLFDPGQGRPIAFKIIPHTLLPQRFTISLPPEAQADPKPAYDLRVLTDRNNDPLGSTEGELIGRSAKPIPLGTMDVDFELDQPYVR